MPGSAALPTLRLRLRRGLRRGGHACWVMLRVTVPTFVAMDLLRRLGVIDAIGAFCAGDPWQIGRAHV